MQEVAASMLLILLNLIIEAITVNKWDMVKTLKTPQYYFFPSIYSICIFVLNMEPLSSIATAILVIGLFNTIKKIYKNKKQRH